MITREKIKDYFDAEFEATKRKNKEFRELSLTEKVAARKAIAGVRMDTDFKERCTEGVIRLLHIKENLSDFKVGDAVSLCLEAGETELCTCHINGFRENGDVEVVIDSWDYPQDVMKRCEEEVLSLIKTEVNMRNLHEKLISRTELRREGFFENHLINRERLPKIQEYSREDERDMMDFIMQWSGIKLKERQMEACMKSAYSEDYYLIQGPPGTGKSLITAILLFRELLGCRKVVLTGPTHMAINNALRKTAELVEMLCPGNKQLALNSMLFKCGKSYNTEGLTYKSKSGEELVIPNIKGCNVRMFNAWADDEGKEYNYGWVIGMTPFAVQKWEEEGLEFDTLYVDEAGQITIPIALMAMVKQCKVILAGDHKQLPPIITEGCECEELKHSLFEHLINEGNSTMLNESLRMNGVICKMISDLFYDGKLKSSDEGKRLRCKIEDPLYSGEKPIVFVDCPEEGQQTSESEAEQAVEILRRYLEAGIPAEEMAVLAPFRAQCALIRRRLAADNGLTAEQRRKIVVETVDSMQGQEREIIIYSFTAGDRKYMQEMADFLYNPNKLNVAFSRAKNKLILLGNVKTLRECGIRGIGGKLVVK